MELGLSFMITSDHAVHSQKGPASITCVALRLIFPTVITVWGNVFKLRLIVSLWLCQIYQQYSIFSDQISIMQWTIQA